MLFSVNIAKVLSLLCRSESIVGTPPLLKEVYNLSKIKSLGGGGGGTKYFARKGE